MSRTVPAKIVWITERISASKDVRPNPTVTRMLGVATVRINRMLSHAARHRFVLVAFLLAVWGFLFAPASSAQTATTESAYAQPESPSVAQKPNPTHKFWDRTNALLFTGVAASRALDYTSTKNMLGRGREEILIPDDVVNSEAGFPALEAAGAATSIGISYIFHRYHHHKLERRVSIVHIGVTSFGAAHNYALKSHP